MATKTISSGENARGFTFSLVMNETTDIETNTSSISWSLQLSLKSGSGWSFYDFGVGWSAYINGTRVANHDRSSSDRYTLTAGNTWTMATGIISVPHDTDGTKTISCSASMDMATSPSGAGAMSLSGDWELTAIPRASSLTIPTLTIGSSATLSVSAASNTFTHTISYVMDDLSGTIASLSAGASSASWAPPTSFYAKIPNAVQGSVTITIDTYTGGALIGSRSYTVPVLVGSDIRPSVPSVTLSPVNNNTWLTSQGLYVGGYSRIRVQSSASPGTGATIASYQISGAFSGTGADITSGILDSGDKSITITATDSRGRSNVTTLSVNFLEYSNPALTTFSAERGLYSSGTWTGDVGGNHIRVNAIATVSLSAQGNTGTISVTVGGASPDVISGNYFIWTSTNSTTTYVATGSVSDNIGRSTQRSITISTVEVPFNINVDLPGAAFGMIAQSPQALELARSWHLQLGGASIPDEDEADHILKMKSDGTGLEWGPMGVGGGLFDADYDPETGEITLWADFASTVTFSYAELTSILTIGEDSDQQFLDKVYPIGSIYMSVNSTSPATLFGGTWVQIQGKWLVGAGTSDNGQNYAAGTAYAQQLPNIKGSIDNSSNVRYPFGRSSSTMSGALSVSSEGSGYAGDLNETGNALKLDFDASRSNSVYADGGAVRPSSLAVYIWQRTA